MYVLQIITSRERKRANQTHSHTLDGSKMEKTEKQKLAETNKSTHLQCDGREIEQQKKKKRTKISKIQDNVECYRERKRDSERKRRRMFVCDNILNKKRESKDLSLTDKQNTRENKYQLEINTHWKHMMKGAESQFVC